MKRTKEQLEHSLKLAMSDIRDLRNQNVNQIREYEILDNQPKRLREQKYTIDYQVGEILSLKKDIFDLECEILEYKLQIRNTDNLKKELRGWRVVAIIFGITSVVSIVAQIIKLFIL